MTGPRSPYTVIPVFPDEYAWLQGLTPGDLVHRMGAVTMVLTVTRVTRDLIECCGKDGWTFDRTNGGEVDECLSGTATWIRPLSS